MPPANFNQSLKQGPVLGCLEYLRMSAEEEDIKPRIAEDVAGSANQEEEGGTCTQEEADENLKIISKKALADYKRAEELFLEFLANADVWSSEEVNSHAKHP